MGKRLRIESPEKMKEYTIKHTRVSQQICGNSVHVLHLMRPTDQFFVSVESWASSCNSLKKKREDFTPEFNIPILTDKPSLDFLTKVWKPKKSADQEDQDREEAERFLSELFPGKKLEYYFELNHLHGSYCNGAFTKSSDFFESRIKQRTYYIIKYLKQLGISDKNIWLDYDKAEEYVKNNDTTALSDVLNTVCSHVVVCPYILPEPILNKHEGEILFIVTEDTVYFEIRRSI